MAYEATLLIRNEANQQVPRVTWDLNPRLLSPFNDTFFNKALINDHKYSWYSTTRQLKPTEPWSRRQLIGVFLTKDSIVLDTPWKETDDAYGSVSFTEAYRG